MGSRGREPDAQSETIRNREISSQMAGLQRNRFPYYSKLPPGHRKCKRPFPPRPFSLAASAHPVPLPPCCWCPRTPWQGARQGVPVAPRATGRHPCRTGTRGEPLASARRRRQQASTAGHGPHGGLETGSPGRVGFKRLLDGFKRLPKTGSNGGMRQRGRAAYAQRRINAWCPGTVSRLALVPSVHIWHAGGI